MVHAAEITVTKICGLMMTADERFPERAWEEEFHMDPEVASWHLFHYGY